MSVAVATRARTSLHRNPAAIRWAAANAMVPTLTRHCSASALSSARNLITSQVSRWPAYGGVPISVSYTRG